jgi:hypothetical protein
MADWFKFYNDGLDEPRLQYAIGEQPAVVSVWLAILSEASKHYQDSFKWRDQDFELFGYAKKVGVSVPVFNQCLGLLEQIEYITRTDGTLKVLKWNKMQSEYCRGIKKGYFKKSRKKLPSNYLDSRIRGEERRREEKREEESTDKRCAVAPRFQKPGIEEVKLQCAKVGLPESEAEKFVAYYESNGWRVGRNPMRSWSHALVNWKTRCSPTPINGHPAPSLRVHELRAVKEAKEQQAKELKHKHCSEVAMGDQWNNQVARQQYLQLRKETKELNDKIAAFGGVA